MVGYIGSKAAVTQVDGYSKSEADARYVEGDDTLYVDQTNNQVGIGTSSPARDLVVSNSSQANIALQTTASGSTLTDGFQIQADGSHAYLWNYENTNILLGTNNTERMRIDSSGQVGIGTSSPNSKLTLSTGDKIFVPTGEALNFGHTDGSTNTERMRIDSSGNLLVGKTSNDNTTAGGSIRAGESSFVADGSRSGTFIRNNSDGEIVEFRKDGSTVGSIGNAGINSYFSTGDTGLLFAANVDAIIPTNQGSTRDNVIDLGNSGNRFDDIYATNGTIQTSDRNEKQDIAELSDAEQRVAVAAKGLMRKFRWRDAVAEKGDDARTHFGVIAQDLQAAFAAEGLDAGDYAMFISTTWWETQTEVPAVEADEENGIEGKDAYTRTDTYNTQEEAPEGATQKTRLGVRYSELLAFIIGAL